MGKEYMTGTKKYYKIPFITKLFKIKFYVSWRDNKFNKIGFQKEMSFSEAIMRLESKRIRRESFNQ